MVCVLFLILVLTFVTKKMLPNLVVIVIFFRSIFSILHYSRIFIFHYKNDLIKTAQEHPEMGYRQVGDTSFYWVKFLFFSCGC